MFRSLTLIATIAFALSLASGANAAACKDAKGKFTKCPAAASATMAKSATTPAPAAAAAPAMSATPATAAKAPKLASAGGAPNCKTGKPCGHACIAQDKVCHK